MKYINSDRFNDTEIEECKQSLFSVLDENPDQAEEVLKALCNGRIDGLAYVGDCGCLYGTIECLKGNVIDDLWLSQHEFTDAEYWFWFIHEGDTPETNEYSAKCVEWIKEWIDTNEND